MPGSSVNLPVAEHWYRARSCPGHVSRINEQYIHPYWAGTIWVVHGTERDIIVDTGTGLVPLQPFVAALSGKPVLAVALCDYYDHAGGLYSFEQRACHCMEAEAISSAGGGRTGPGFTLAGRLTAVPVAGFEIAQYTMTPATLTRLLQDGDSIDLGNRELEVIHIPGRTPGSIALWEAQTGFLFGGETLFIDPQRNNFPPEDVQQYEQSLARLATLPVTTVFGGHYGSFSARLFEELIISETGRYC